MVAVGVDTHVQVGTLGVSFLMDFCGECRSCKMGLTNQCLNKRGDLGFKRDGGYGAFKLIPESVFFPVDADLEPTEATLLLDVMGTNGHAIKHAISQIITHRYAPADIQAAFELFFGGQTAKVMIQQ